MTITLNQKRNLLILARIVIADNLGIAYPTKRDDLDLNDPFYSQKLGAFVTLHKSGVLRGCIGYITGIKDIVSTIEDMAYSAAFRDPRFSPLTRDEFDLIDIEISILSPIAQVKSVEEIEVGRDGLIISNGINSGLLLPQVPVEQGWDLNSFLEHTCLKACLPPDAWKRKDVLIEKFSATVFGEKE
ncbi:MAG: AmmeMemoRadiSam system protein A [Spirochaetota bacterium]